MGPFLVPFAQVGYSIIYPPSKSPPSCRTPFRSPPSCHRFPGAHFMPTSSFHPLPGDPFLKPPCKRPTSCHSLTGAPLPATPFQEAFPATPTQEKPSCHPPFRNFTSCHPPFRSHSQDFLLTILQENLLSCNPLPQAHLPHKCLHIVSCSVCVVVIL